MQRKLSRLYRYRWTADPDSVLDLIRSEQFDVVIADVALIDREPGLSLFSAITTNLPQAKLILFAESSDDKLRAIRLLRKGAFDTLSFPFYRTELRRCVERAVHAVYLETYNRTLLSQVEPSAVKEFLTSTPLKDKYPLVTNMAETELPVVLSGEKGTEKQNLASLIHQLGKRPGAFVALDAASMSLADLETELFGSHKVASKISVATRGTIFIDNFQEIGLAMQQELQNATVRLYSGELPRFQCRIIAGTNERFDDLARRQILHTHHLFTPRATLALHVPPLREFRGSIQKFAKYYISQIAPRENRSFHESAIAAMEAYEWPGNFRQLENHLRAALLVSGNVIVGEHLAINNLETSVGAQEFIRKGGGSLSTVLTEVRAAFLHRALKTSYGNLSKAAGELGMSRPTLYRLAEELGIELEKSGWEMNREEFLELLKKNGSLAKMAAALGVNYRTITRLAAKLEIRPRKEPETM
jgi:DNA-binding NtrC family response regulator